MGIKDWHRIRHRWAAVVIAIIVMVGDTLLVFSILNQEIDWQNSSHLVLVLAVSPVLSATAITIFMIVGAFRVQPVAPQFPAKLFVQLISKDSS